MKKEGIEIGTEAGLETEVGTEIVAGAGNVIEVEAGTEAEIGVGIEPEIEAGIEAGTGLEIGAETEIKVEQVIKFETEQGIEAEIGMGPGIETGIKADQEVDIDIGTAEVQAEGGLLPGAMKEIAKGRRTRNTTVATRKVLQVPQVAIRNKLVDQAVVQNSLKVYPCGKY